MDANKIGGRSEARRDGESQKIEGFKALFELVKNTSKKRKKKKKRKSRANTLFKGKKKKEKKEKSTTYSLVHS